MQWRILHDHDVRIVADVPLQLARRAEVVAAPRDGRGGSGQDEGGDEGGAGQRDQALEKPHRWVLHTRTNHRPQADIRRFAGPSVNQPMNAETALTPSPSGPYHRSVVTRSTPSFVLSGT